METNDQKLKRLLSEIDLEERLPKGMTEGLYRKLWFSVKKFMGLPLPPRIILQNFGTFQPSLVSMEKRIEKLKSSDKKQLEKEEEIRRLEEARDFYARENSSRKHLHGEEGEVQGTDSGL